MTSRRVGIVGAGAIGGWLADALDRAGWVVSLVARGETLAALRDQGLRVEQAGELRHSRPFAGSAAECGAQDFVFLTVKAQSLPALAPSLAPLLGPSTVVIGATNGIPWWFFQDFGGPLCNQVLDSVDPHSAQARTFARDLVLGSVVHASALSEAPGHVRVVAADRLLVGEPGGALTARVQEIVAALRAGGIEAAATFKIRDEVWAKLWGNMNMNPLSALTRSGTQRLLDDPEVRTLCLRMMEEMRQCGALLQLNSTMTPTQRIEITRRLGDFRTSMLADVEAGRPLEFAPQLGAVVEIADRLAVPAPFCRAILGLTRLVSA